MAGDDYKPFKPLEPKKGDNGYRDQGIQPIENLPEGGDLHDTIRIDRNGHIGDGHTTVQTPGKPNVNLPWTPPADTH